MWTLVAAALACPDAPDAALVVTAVTRDAALDAAFGLEADGWLGADAAHSVPVAPDRAVWLFGDTFWGGSDGRTRAPGAVLDNGSVAIHDPSAPGAPATFFRGDDPTGFFDHRPPSAGSFYWTTNGVLHDDALYVFAMNVESLWRQEGFTVLRVDDPLADPSTWTWTVTDVPLGDEAGLPITALHIADDHLYMFGFDDRAGPSRRTVLARATVAALEDGLTPEDVTWFAGDEVWSADPADAATLLDRGVTESHVQWVPALGRWVLAMSDVLTGELQLTSAPSLTGPWSTPQCVTVAPEVDRVDGLWTYAARPHPEYATAPDEVVLTYVVNPFGTIEPLFAPGGGALYRPRFVRVRLALNAPPVVDAPEVVAASAPLEVTVAGAIPGETLRLGVGAPDGTTPFLGCATPLPASDLRPLGRASADDDGAATFAVTAPPAPGTHRLVVAGRRCPVGTLDIRVE